jgi:hypothetical protein
MGLLSAGIPVLYNASIGVFLLSAWCTTGFLLPDPELGPQFFISQP